MIFRGLKVNDRTQIIKVSQEEIQSNIDKVLEIMLTGGDLRCLTGRQRLVYYKHLCEREGLNTLTLPFYFIELPDGAVKIYANKNCAEQITRRDNISIEITHRETVELIHSVYVKTTIPPSASNPAGRTGNAVGVVALTNKYGKLTGIQLANMLMTAETKAKRRGALSIAGLGMLDETEVETIHGAKKIQINVESGE